MMIEMLNDAFDWLHDQSLPSIELLQNSFPDNKNFMINVSTLFDPRYVFLIYAPILFALNKRVAHRTLIALTLTEWSNQILKWLLAGERPYWYVHERAEELNAISAPQNVSSLPLSGIRSYDLALAAEQQPMAVPTLHLKQFPVTCELGAGSPSGHAMVTATVWYVLVDAYLRGELLLWGRPSYQVDGQRSPAQDSGQLFQRLGWIAYGLILVLVSLSRVYLACHFPHQCLCGAILGVLIARLVVERLPMERLSSMHFVLATAFMFASALSTYALLRAMGRNPLWSVDKGMRWCVKKEYIHLDTTPFFSMMRYLGFCIGAGLAYDTTKLVASNQPTDRTTSAEGAHLLIRRSIVALSSIVCGYLLMGLPVPKESQQLFYFISFIMHAVFSYIIAGPIPRFCKQSIDQPASCERITN